jgi:hypothetical protein
MITMSLGYAWIAQSWHNPQRVTRRTRWLTPDQQVEVDAMRAAKQTLLQQIEKIDAHLETLGQDA